MTKILNLLYFILNQKLSFSFFFSLLHITLLNQPLTLRASAVLHANSEKHNLEKMKTLYLTSLSELENTGKEFISLMGENKVFAFYGEMGAGKTTFIKTVCQLLGVEENITSPTFAIVNEYITRENSLIYHFDCYRLKNIQEAHDIGAEEYFYSGNVCFIEWPEKIDDLLPGNVVSVKISVLPDQQREITVE